MGRPGKPTGRVSAKIAARRGRQVLMLLAAGVDQSTIARRLDLSRQRVHQIAGQAERRYRDRQMVGRLREGA
jgi:DNA-binding CsgD family transcriptional regulator